MGEEVLDPVDVDLDLEHSFIDRKGRKWVIEMNMGIAEAIDATDFSVLMPGLVFSAVDGGKELFLEALPSPRIAAAIAWIVVSYVDEDGESQVKKHFGTSVTEENADDLQRKFVSALGGSAKTALRNALWGAFADFFPEEKTVLLTWREELERAENQMSQKVTEMRGQISKAFDKEMTKHLRLMQRELESLSVDTDDDAGTPSIKSLLSSDGSQTNGEDSD